MYTKLVSFPKVPKSNSKIVIEADGKKGIFETKRKQFENFEEGSTSGMRHSYDVLSGYYPGLSCKLGRNVGNLFPMLRRR